AGLAFLVGRLPAGILDRLLRRPHRHDDEGVHLLLVFGRHVVVGVELAGRGVAARHFARDLARQVGHVDGLHAADTGLSLQQAIPDILDAHAQRRDDAHSGDDDTTHGTLLSCHFRDARGSRRPRRSAQESEPRERSQLAFDLIYSMASLTVWIFSAASSGISQPNSSSNAITSSTVSRLSAPTSSMKDAVSVTLASSTPRCSITIFLTRSAMSLIAVPFFDHRPPSGAGRKMVGL